MKLHGILQIVEAKLMKKIKSQILLTVEKITNNHRILSDSVKNLEEMILTLENLIKPNSNYKSNITVPNVIQKINKILEGLPCEVTYDMLPKKQFALIEVPNIEAILEEILQINMSKTWEPYISTYFGEIVYDNKNTTNDKSKQNKPNDNSKINKKNNYFDSFSSSSENVVSNNSNIKILKRPDLSSNVKQNLLLELSSIEKSNYSTKKELIHNKMMVNAVHVSHIKNPQKFYIQNEVFKSNFINFQHKCKLEADISLTINYIDIDEIYLVPNSGTWFRGKVLDILNSDLCKVFLIDTGATLTISRHCFKTIPDILREIENGAQKCSVYGVKPKGESWNDEANEIMSEIIAGQMIEMVVVKNEKDQFLVDLISRKVIPTSLRDALIHTDVADTVDILDDKILIKNINEYNRIKHQFIPPITKTFYEPDLESQAEIRVIVLNALSPSEFYVAKVSDENNIIELQAQLTEDLLKKEDLNYGAILVPRENMVCAVKIRGTWFRAKIISVDSRIKCDVHLVDVGGFKQVTWKQLRKLDNKFLNFNSYSFRCSLNHIEPIKGIEWSTDAIDEFKRFCQSKNLFIFSNYCKVQNHAAKVTLYISKPNMDLNVNAMMVHANHAKSTGPESKKIEFFKENIKLNMNNGDENLILDTKIGEEKKSEHRKIQIIHIVSPGEFYINLESYIESINNLQKEIKIVQERKIMNNSEFILNEQWNTGDSCLVLISLRKYEAEKWYRGRIIKISENVKLYSVFLRDFGQTFHNVNKAKISSIDDSLNRIVDNALRCNLACCKTTGDLPDWSKSSIDYFKDLAKQYESISYASIYGERNKNNSIPIILWIKTINKYNPLSPETYQWNNLNMQLVNEGYAHLIESFNLICDNEWKTITDNLDKTIIKTFNEEELDIIDDVFKSRAQKTNFNITAQLDFTDCDNDNDPDNIKNWLSPIPIDKSIFNGIPTFVDDEASIYLHDSNQINSLNQIKSFINKKFESYLMTNIESRNWQQGEPCIARYHLDNLFYRAKIVEKISDDNYKVLFVDYGNVEDCKDNDLIKKICLTKVPIQANIYKIAGIKPTSFNGKWCRDVLDFIHISIVGKQCVIRVEADSIARKDLIKKCKINAAEFGDLNDLLITKNFAIKELQGMFSSNAGKSILKALHGYVEEDTYSETAEEILVRLKNDFSTEKEPEPETYYQEYFEREELLELQKSDDNLNDNDNDITFQSGKWQHSQNSGEKLLSESEDDDENYENALLNDDNPKINLLKDNFGLDSSVNSFNPKDTSTVISRFEGLEYYLSYEIPFGTRGFNCEVNFIRSSTNFFIVPLIEDHVKNYNEMSRKLQNYIKTAPLMEKPVELYQPCVANFSEDNLWYRALICSKNRSNEYCIRYIDFMNSTTVTVDKLRKINKTFLKYPLRLIEVKIFGLRPNERWRENDIKRRLSQLLRDKVVYCKIKKMGKIPEIEFYGHSKSKTLILQPMIEEKYFLKEY